MTALLTPSLRSISLHLHNPSWLTWRIFQGPISPPSERLSTISNSVNYCLPYFYTRQLSCISITLRSNSLFITSTSSLLRISTDSSHLKCRTVPIGGRTMTEIFSPHLTVFYTLCTYRFCTPKRSVWALTVLLVKLGPPSQRSTSLHIINHILNTAYGALKYPSTINFFVPSNCLLESTKLSQRKSVRSYWNCSGLLPTVTLDAISQQVILAFQCAFSHRKNCC